MVSSRFEVVCSTDRLGRFTANEMVTEVQPNEAHLMIIKTGSTMLENLCAPRFDHTLAKDKIFRLKRQRAPRFDHRIFT